MEVILREDFPALGFIGDRVSVRGGYARNFLLPRGIAIEASNQNEKRLKHEMSGITSKRIKLRSESQKVADDLASKTLNFTLKTGDKGKIFGTITTKDIESELNKLGFQIDRRRIKLSDAVRRAGNFTAEIRLHPEVNVQIPVQVKLELVEEETKQADAPTEDQKTKRTRSRKKKQDNDDAKVAE